MANRGDALVGVGALAALTWWQVVAAVYDGRHVEGLSVAYAVSGDDSPDFSFSATAHGGHPTWVFASVFLGRAIPLLLAAIAGLIWVDVHTKRRDGVFRSCGWAIVGCAGAVAVIGAGALADPHLAAAALSLGNYPDTIRANAGAELVVGAGAAVTALAFAVRALRTTSEATSRAAAENSTALSGKAPQVTGSG